MQHPLVAYIDNTNLVRVTITQTDQRMSFKPDSFKIWDEDDNPLEIIDTEEEPRNLFITGEFFDWKEDRRGKMKWDSQAQYYYCELPLSLVKDSEFKFIENRCLWYPQGDNLKVDKLSGLFHERGYLLCDNKVRFILKNKMFGFTSFELILRTRQKFSPEKTYFLNYCCRHRITLINRDIFNQPQFFYPKSDLGFNWSTARTVFRIWSPVADELKVLIYKNPNSQQAELVLPMHRAENGTWKAVAEGNWQNFYYLYQIRINQNTWQQIDPYSHALALNSTHSLIFDENSAFPLGWKEQPRPVLKSPTDAVIYELHLRDFSISPHWQGPQEWRGKYLGLTWSGSLAYKGKKVTTGLAHLKELGVNVIQLLPVFDFNTVDETGNDPSKLRNWGYDPVAYNVPEGSYAQNGDDQRRLLEFRQMIMKLHQEGFKIVMDVVYNHTAHVGAPFSIFDTFMPEYFYRMDTAGHYTNGSGCGNEVASEKPMVRKYIIDSLIYWLTEFKIDGFRFDLMGLIDLETMKQITQELRARQSDVLIYGEPWSGGASPLVNPTHKGSQKNLGFAVFNDHFRDSIRGDTDGTAKGWVMGNKILRQKVINGINGSLDDFAASPTETINYISAHDNYTWYDKLVRTMPKTSKSKIVKTARLGLALVLTSQGIPFLHAGSEFLRTKRIKGAMEEEIRNSYRASDEINKLNWMRKIEYLEFFNYIKHLIAIRHKYSAFRIADPRQIKKRVIPLKTGVPDELIATFIDGLNIDTDLIIIHNPLDKAVLVKLPAGIWRIIFDDQYINRKLMATHIDSKINVSPISTTILELD